MILRVLALTCAAALAACVEFPAAPDGTGATGGVGNPGTGGSGGPTGTGGCSDMFRQLDEAGDGDTTSIASDSRNAIAVGRLSVDEDDLSDLWSATPCADGKGVELSWFGDQSDLELSPLGATELSPGTTCICPDSTQRTCSTLTGELPRDSALTLEVGATSTSGATLYNIELCDPIIP
ncbi:MAG: hypothetical protein AAF436_09515 [Myxococcota bacterium]